MGKNAKLAKEKEEKRVEALRLIREATNRRRAGSKKEKKEEPKKEPVEAKAELKEEPMDADAEPGVEEVEVTPRVKPEPSEKPRTYQGNLAGLKLLKFDGYKRVDRQIFFGARFHNLENGSKVLLIKYSDCRRLYPKKAAEYFKYITRGRLDPNRLVDP
ncbi:hypothetical protein L596_013905 [Steinernema carpocapsae]|uniref:Uncharacterized protein n=1 Tax=Steinernema carpocapsae TaxID=34508 RepID=A0A4U5P2Z4_STECR|nr:hypothetical protein L596_013905 [Steinernema carpocapsae]